MRRFLAVSLLVLSSLVIIEARPAAGDLIATNQSCVLHILQADDVGVVIPVPSPVREIGCFPSLDAALGFVSGNTFGCRNVNVELIGCGSSSGDPGGADRTVIGIDWDLASRQGGDSIVWTVDGSQGCTSGMSWYVDSMPPGWNDRVSSSQSYSGCSSNPHYEHVYHQGAIQPCPCARMDVMDNQTSSERWLAS